MTSNNVGFSSVQVFNIPSLKIVTSIGVYLNMYNLLLAYSRHVPSA